MWVNYKVFGMRIAQVVHFTWFHFKLSATKEVVGENWLLRLINVTPK